jgi:hypothetical protein
MGVYRGHSPKFLGLARRLVRGGSPVNAHKLGLSLGEGSRRNAKALSGSIVAEEGDTEIGGEIGDGEVGKEDYGKIGRYAGF